MPRSPRSKQEPPTKHFFIPTTNGTALSQVGAFTGYDIDGDAEDSWIVFMVPHDYGEMIFCDLMVIGLLASASMTVSVDASYGTFNEVATAQDNGPIRYTLTSLGLNQIQAIDIRQLLIGGGTTRPIADNDIVGIHAERLAIMSDNTDLLVLGVHFAYK